MTQQNQQQDQPYVATASASNWEATFTKLNEVAQLLQTQGSIFWSVLETPFELNLACNRLELPQQGGVIGRGRLFWSEAEIRFRYDGSRLNSPYRLVLVASQPPAGIAGYQAATGRLQAIGWEPTQNFQNVLWGTPLATSEGMCWFNSRIPKHLVYEGIGKVEDFPMVEGKAYLRSGRVEFFRFMRLLTSK